MKTRIRKALNLLLYLAFCVMLGTGLLLVLRLPWTWTQRAVMEPS